MGKTIAEKILAEKCDSNAVTPGEFILANIDVALANDITAPIAIEQFRKMTSHIFDKEKILLVMDHFNPAKDIKASTQIKFIREFAKEQGIKHYYDVGRMGIEHCLLPEQGHVYPGALVVGADSHTCTYGGLGAFATGVGSTDLGFAMATGKVWLKVPDSIKFVYTGGLPKWVSGKDLILHTIGLIGVDGANYKAMEFTGPVIDNLSIAGRFTMCNMAIEAGGKTGIVNPDEKTAEYMKGRSAPEYKPLKSDPDAEYINTIEIECNSLESQVSLPHLPENAKPISEVTSSNITIDQAVIGSCTNGRLEDLRVAAMILKNRKVNPDVRCVILPGTQQIYLDAMKEGIIEIFIKSNCAVSTPTCGPCLGGYMGILAEGEKAISTTNRNFVGRMGHAGSEVYLSSPVVAAASAIKGYICGPEELDWS
ncbi:MAG: 3-isopropylmalate dehydratase large subunit [Candidatus Hodarchaeota archaeon]